MNSEELELSLRSEFENYLKTVVAEMRKESTEFQSKIEAEFDRHKSQFDEAFQSFNARFDSEHQFDDGFLSLVNEHLNLARDAGSKLAAEDLETGGAGQDGEARAAALAPPSTCAAASARTPSSAAATTESGRSATSQAKRTRCPARPLPRRPR